MTLKLSLPQITKIKEVLPTLRWVEEKTGVPWEAVAALWYRESFSINPPKTPGGPFQFDPPLNSMQIVMLLSKFSKLSKTEINIYSIKGINDFRTAAICCACFLRLKCKPVITPNISDEDIKDAFYGYNGRAYGSVDKSPYVMNGYDASHMNMELRGTIPDGRGGRTRIRIVDKRPGAFTVYKQLQGLHL